MEDEQSDDEKLAEEVEDLERLEHRLLAEHALDAHARRSYFPARISSAISRRSA